MAKRAFLGTVIVILSTLTASGCVERLTAEKAYVVQVDHDSTECSPGMGSPSLEIWFSGAGPRICENW